MIHKNRGNRRWQDERKAKRKQRICRDVMNGDVFEHFGMYRKGKIHCSCPMCSAKMNGRLNRSNGPVDQGHRAHSARISCTKNRLGKYYCFADERKIRAMQYEEMYV